MRITSGTDLVFISEDTKFSLLLPWQTMTEMLSLCAKSFGRETGGTFYGVYTEDGTKAIAHGITKPSCLSLCLPSLFIRRTGCLTRFYRRLWREKNQYYLGEWHFHPQASSRPSNMDLEQMKKLAAYEKLHCPEPIMLIIGRTPPTDWEISVFVFPRGQNECELFQIQSSERRENTTAR